jgi:hypothetical protein
MQLTEEKIAGYDYGESRLETSAISLQELSLLKKTLLWSEDDDNYLRMAGDVLKDQTHDILDLWYDYVSKNEHLLYYFGREGSKPNAEYLDAVRKRFEQWIIDLCHKPYDQSWLNYQYEIAKRHHTIGKNKTDNVDAAPIVNFRYLVAFIYPITITIKPFLEKSGKETGDVEGMYNAWFKAVNLSVLLWCYPYVNKGQF